MASIFAGRPKVDVCRVRDAMRLAAGQQWTRKGSPPLKGPGPWSDFVAVNGACDKTSNTYMPATRGDRDLSTLRQKQIHGVRELGELLRRG